ncbi:MAG TPA: rod shape-determining protein [Blastocatellia bacterium]|nr:rod shape-determining protein [Blastocatellia bacterium]
MSDRGWKEKLERLWRSSFQGLNLTSTEDLAIDLGAANTRVYLPGKGVVINEPTVIALDTRSGKVAAVGQEAKALARRQPLEIRVARPVKDGAVADCVAAGQMLSQFLRRALTHRSLAGLSLLICVPADITPLEQKAYEDAARRAGAGKVTFIEEPYAAAVGAGLNIWAAGASMVVDLGAATTGVAVIGGGGLLYASTRRVGGSEIDRSIARYLQLERTLEVSGETAEKIKIELGGVDAKRDGPSLAVRGRNLRTGLPEELIVVGEEIHPLIQPALRVIKQHVRTALEEISTEASVDLLDSGVTLSGGFAQLPGLAEHLNREFGLSVRVASDPALATALGAGHLLEQESHVSAQEAMRERESVGWRPPSSARIWNL